MPKLPSSYSQSNIKPQHTTMEMKWEDGFTIAVKIENNAVIITANKEGLLSLANHMAALAQDNAPGAHFHLDEHNALEENSTELIIEKID